MVRETREQAKGAAVTKPRIKVECLECGAKFSTTSEYPECPKCGGVDVDVR